MSDGFSVTRTQAFTELQVGNLNISGNLIVSGTIGYRNKIDTTTLVPGHPPIQLTAGQSGTTFVFTTGNTNQEVVTLPPTEAGITFTFISGDVGSGDQGFGVPGIGTPSADGTVEIRVVQGDPTPEVFLLEGEGFIFGALGNDHTNADYVTVTCDGSVWRGSGMAVLENIV